MVSTRTSALVYGDWTIFPFDGFGPCLWIKHQNSFLRQHLPVVCCHILWISMRRFDRPPMPKNAGYHTLILRTSMHCESLPHDVI